MLRFKGKICILIGENMKRMILDGSHQSQLGLHLGMNKMYQDLKKFFWWSDKMKEIAQYVGACLTCQ